MKLSATKVFALELCWLEVLFSILIVSLYSIDFCSPLFVPVVHNPISKKYIFPAACRGVFKPFHKASMQFCYFPKKLECRNMPPLMGGYALERALVLAACYQ